ncbi:polysaccharide export protein [bacterium]|nr:polysaccharide export protein [bacterium]
MIIKLYKYINIICFMYLIVIIAGCSSGNKLIDTRNGEIKTGILSPDSLPHTYMSEVYRLGYGDVFDVHFLYNDEYSHAGIRVGPDGTITYPYLGEIVVAGKTISELDSILTIGFSRIIRDPDISIIQQIFRPKYVYLLGEVESPGSYPAEQAGTLLQALALGKGITEKARENGVIVVRRIGPKHVVGIQIDLKKIIDGNHYEYNIEIEPSDIIMVPKSRIYKVSGFVGSFLDIFERPVDLYLSGWQFVQTKAIYDYYRLRDTQ